MRGKLEELIASGFGKAAHYTPEENERYGGVNLNCSNASCAARTSPMIWACARRTCA